MDEVKLPIMIMAGTGKDDPDELLNYANVKYKSLIKLNGETMLELILKAAFSTGMFTKYYILGLPEDVVVLPAEMNKEDVVVLHLEDRAVPERLDGATKYILKEAETNPNIFPGKTKHGLLLAGDVPFITGEIIQKFVGRIQKFDRDFYPAAVKKEYMVQRFPKSSRTYGKTKEGLFCIADISSFDYSMVADRIPTIKIIRQNRKKFLRVILRTKPSILLKYIFKRMSVVDIEDVTLKVLRTKTTFILMDTPEIAMDIDKPHQLDMAIEEFAKLGA